MGNYLWTESALEIEPVVSHGARWKARCNEYAPFGASAEGIRVHRTMSVDTRCAQSVQLAWCMMCQVPLYGKIALASCGPVPMLVTWNEATPTDEGRHGFGSGVAAAVTPSNASHRSITCVPTSRNLSVTIAFIRKCRVFTGTSAARVKEGSGLVAWRRVANVPPHAAVCTSSTSQRVLQSHSACSRIRSSAFGNGDLHSRLVW